MNICELLVLGKDENDMKKALLSMGILLSLTFINTYAEAVPMDVLDAVRDKNNVRLEEFLQSGADPNSMTVTGQNLLTYAVLMRNTEAVNLLINKGADVNTPNKQGGMDIYPIGIAVGFQDIPTVKSLINAGAKTDIVVGGQPLKNIAQFMNNRELVNILNRSNYEALDEKVTTKTILSTLSAEDIEKAKKEASKGKRASYDLYEKGRSFWDAMVYGVNKANLRLALSTPYSQLRHLYYEETENFVIVDNAEKQAIIDSKDKVYIIPYSLDSYGLYGTIIKNLVIKKDGKIYHAKEVEAPIMLAKFVSSNVYAFDINLFDGEPMEIIAVDAATDQKLVMPIDGSFYKKRGWY